VRRGSGHTTPPRPIRRPSRAHATGNQDDLAGYLEEEEQGGFEILNLPAVATQTKTYELGGGRTYVRQQGELLHPSHEPASVLL
jgi:hypothetical protein